MAEKKDKPTRFSDREKDIIYSLFEKYKCIIDHKYRKNSAQKQSEVRNCWNIIHDTFNQQTNEPPRTLKQIQKFWMNSKLRNRFPSPLHQAYIESNINPKEEHMENMFDHQQSGEHQENPTDDNNIEINFIQSPHSRLLISSANSMSEKNPFGDMQDDAEFNSTPEHMDENNDEDNHHQHHNNDEFHIQNISTVHFSKKMNILRLQEMEYRVKESKHRSNLQQISWLKAKEELKHMRQVHELQLEEMKIKLDNLKNSTFK